MGTRVADRVDGWEQRSFSDGYRGLRDLTDADFSGVVRAGGADLYMTKGTVVGIDGGTVEDFEGASGTAYRAPSPALPLLAVMQGRSDEVRAKYYTEETPMSEVDRTLSDGGFTGYVELSENVLSGDYYLVYHQGRSMSVAFVGNSRQLVDGDEAFETANDEVGIYEVRPVEIEAIDVPAPEPEPEPEPEQGAGPTPDTGPDAGTVGTAAGEATGAADEAVGEDTVADSRDGPGGRTGANESGTAAGEAGDANPAAGTEATEEPGDATSPSTNAGADSDARPDAGATDRQGGAAEPSTDPAEAAGHDGPEGGGTQGGRPDAERGAPDPDRESRTEPGDPSGGGGRPGRANRSEARPETHQDPEAGPGTQQDPEPSPGRGGQDPAAEQGAATQSPGAETDEPTPAREPAPAEDPPEQASEDAGVALETRSVPSLDPERTSGGEPGGGGTSTGAQSGPTQQTTADTGPRAESATPSGATSGPDAGRGAKAGTDDRTAPDREPGTAGPEQAGPDPGEGGATVDAEAGQGPASGDVPALREQLDDRNAELERLETELAEETERREELEREVADLREERDELAAEVERLETELERVEEEFGVATGASQRLTPAEALEGTDLFVRYQSKNGTTLTDAHDGDGGREDVTENLRLEQHTQFEASEVAVDGQDYEAFIRSRVEYQFVTWIVEDLLFEVRDTGGADGLADLYDAIPEVDRAELNGTIAVRYTEDGTEQRGQETFDIVLRDRMGDPLFVADLNDSREGATEGMMERLITAAERVGGSKDTLAGAFLVTESFFEPEALETAAEATKGGLLSRDKRKSFVNLSRKQGYHLCLVEARNQNFHLAVPEL